jgi:hypothetical protein
MGLPAIDCIQRGVTSLRANWELALVQLLQSLAVTAVVLAGLLPPLAVVGFGTLDALRGAAPGDPLALQRALSAWLGALRVDVTALAAACGATALVWLLAFLLYCWFQGGIYGVLAAADRQAPPGALREVAWFRTYRWRDLRGWAGRFTWRFFAFWCFALLPALAGALATAGWIGLVAWGWARWGGGAALGIGCGGALPIAFGWGAFALWTNLAAAALAEEESGVLAAARHGLAVLGRRLGGVLLIALVFAAAAVATSLVFAPLSMAFDFILREELLANLTATAVLGLAQAMLSSLIGVAAVGTLIALVRSERTSRETPA